MSERRCPECGRSLDGLMSSDPSKPGFGRLLRGDGDDRLLVFVARLGGLLAVFAVAVVCFWALSLGIVGT